MEHLQFTFKAEKKAKVHRDMAIIGVVASGNLEVMVERQKDDKNQNHALCAFTIKTASHGFAKVWQAVLEDFNEVQALGGLHISINDGGARPDTVLLRLSQAIRLMEGA